MNTLISLQPFTINLLLSRIKGLICVLNSSTEYNVDFIYCKKGKASELSFCFRFTIYTLMVSKLLDLLFYFTVKENFLD